MEYRLVTADLSILFLNQCCTQSHNIINFFTFECSVAIEIFTEYLSPFGVLWIFGFLLPIILLVVVFSLFVTLSIYTHMI